MKAVFRVDASLLIGSGHVMRCLVLADELKRNGYEIVFACSPLEGDMRSFIVERGFEVATLPKPRKNVLPTHDADYHSWLQKDISDDAKDFVESIRTADLVITDHYAIEKEWQTVVIDALKCRMIAIDDLARYHQADLVLDQTLGRARVAYSDCAARVLVGSQYALLHPSFSRNREQALSRQLLNSAPKILVSMGGVDKPNATLKVLEALQDHSNTEFTVLLSPRAPHFKLVQTWCESKPNITHLEFVSDMASLMLNHDIAIGAPGTTSWERACLGLPNIVVPLAENQNMICQQLVSHNAAIKIELQDIPARLNIEYKRLIEQWDQFKSANLALCDGRGVKRVVYEIDQILSPSAASISLEYATKSDISLIYQWQCHPNTRKHALTKAIPTWDEHQAWMSKKLQSVGDYFYMVVERESGQSVGAIRLDRKFVGNYLVSIFVEPTNYGRGIASKALDAIDHIHPDITLHATVLKANLASQKLFHKAGYSQIDEEAFIRKPTN